MARQLGDHRASRRREPFEGLTTERDRLLRAHAEAGAATGASAVGDEDAAANATEGAGGASERADRATVRRCAALGPHAGDWLGSEPAGAEEAPPSDAALSDEPPRDRHTGVAVGQPCERRQQDDAGVLGDDGGIGVLRR